MKTSQLFLATLKETPKHAQLASHQFMLRAGLIRSVASGLYSWMPLGLKVLKNVEAIIREEMNKIGANEILMPVIQPSELWKETNRWDEYGPLLFRLRDQNEREFCLGPTHEEIITDIFRKSVKSYKQLPTTLYQIQTKFRDEIRPRFGIMRAREFQMKDAYSFDLDESALNQSYEKMFNAYNEIFKRLGLVFRAVLADSGNIGGKLSHEFQVLADSGEDEIFYSDKSDYAANRELAEAVAIEHNSEKSGNAKSKLTVENSKALKEAINPTNYVNTFLVKGVDDKSVALCIRADHTLNELKIEKHPMVHSPLTFLTKDETYNQFGTHPDFIGPVGLSCDIIADRTVLNMVDFSCGANEKNTLYENVNWKEDCPKPDRFDIRNVVVGDKSPDGKGTLKSKRGIEVGHIFQLGDKYSKAMDATVLDKNGKKTTVLMGCYGIGISRILGAVIEQHHDDNGIIWPESIAPYKIALVPINYHKSDNIKKYTDELYQTLLDIGYEVILDDRNERPGVLFADMDLIGIPHRFVLSEKGLSNNSIEYKKRDTEEVTHLKADDVISELKKILPLS